MAAGTCIGCECANMLTEDGPFIARNLQCVAPGLCRCTGVGHNPQIGCGLVFSDVFSSRTGSIDTGSSAFRCLWITVCAVLRKPVLANQPEVATGCAVLTMNVLMACAPLALVGYSACNLSTKFTWTGRAVLCRSGGAGTALHVCPGLCLAPSVSFCSHRSWRSLRSLSDSSPGVRYCLHRNAWADMVRRSRVTNSEQCSRERRNAQLIMSTNPVARELELSCENRASMNCLNYGMC